MPTGAAGTPAGRAGVAAMAWVLPGLILMTALFVVPLAQVAWTSVAVPAPGFDNYATLATDPLFRRVLVNTAVSAIGTTLICLLVGYPAAYLIYRARGPWRAVLLGAVLFSYAVGTMPRAFSWLVILGDRGVLNQLLTGPWGPLSSPVPMLFNQTGVLVGMVHVMLPFMILVLLGSMLRVPRSLMPAAQSLGAGPVLVFLRVFLPLTRPGILAGGMIVAVYSLGFFVVPAVLGGARETTAVMAIRDLALSLGNWGLASALAMLVVLLALGGAWFYVRTTGLAHAHLAD
jgi:putative spermidine/putrescine transport system permease protein